MGSAIDKAFQQRAQANDLPQARMKRYFKPEDFQYFTAPYMTTRNYTGLGNNLGTFKQLHPVAGASDHRAKQIIAASKGEYLGARTVAIVKQSLLMAAKANARQIDQATDIARPVH